jgi:MFS transporter, PAT family, beta-lactamase induction signal transducer AmpG
MTKRTPPWIFALTGVPYGTANSFSVVLMPFLAASAGVSIDDIGWFVTLMFVPTMLQFLYTPVVDFGPKRRSWLLIVTVVSAALIVIACLIPIGTDPVPFLALAFAAQTVSGLIGSCNGGLLATTIPDEQRGRAGAWYNIGNLCGGGLSGSVAIYMTGHDWPPLGIGLTLAGMMILPAFAVLWIDEAPRVKTAVGAAFRTTLRGVRSVLLSRSGISGILLCLSPVGTVALSNYFSALAGDYVRPGIVVEHAESVATVIRTFLLEGAVFEQAVQERSSEILAFYAQGILGQLMIALGAYVGGRLCDAYNRRVMYLLAGMLTVLCAFTMALSPRVELTFIVGVFVYQLITGLSYAAFSAMVLETIGSDSASATTKYAMFTAAGNAAITYVGLVDTRFHEAHGVEGVLWSDGLMNLGGVIVLATVFTVFGMFRKPTATV